MLEEIDKSPEEIMLTEELEVKVGLDYNQFKEDHNQIIEGKIRHLVLALTEGQRE